MPKQTNKNQNNQLAKKEKGKKCLFRKQTAYAQEKSILLD